MSWEQPLTAVYLRLQLHPAAQEQHEAECEAVSLRDERRAKPLIVGFLEMPSAQVTLSCRHDRCV